MTATLSKTQIDRLGDRLRRGLHTEADLRLLDGYRRSFAEAYEAVVGTVRQCLQFPAGRPAKSTVSIVEKLRRESIRLSQMQDIAGCRVVVTDVVEQERVVASLGAAFPGASIMDRRANPSYGYRAVHIIAEISGKPIEIQVRSSLQHLWAELSEKSSDVLDSRIKYGGGPDMWRSRLIKSSECVAAYEKAEKLLSAAMAVHEKFEKGVAELAAELPEQHEPDHELQELLGKLEDAIREMERRKQKLQETRGELVRLWNKNADVLNEMISRLDNLKRQKQ